MIALDIHSDEKQQGVLIPQHLQTAIHALQIDGFVVLNDVIEHSHLETLRERMLSDVAQIQAREDAPYNFNTGNIQQDPPPFPPYLFRDVLLNEMVIAVTKAMLGSGVKNSYYSGNTALPGGQKQPVHPDIPQLWPDLEIATPPFGFVINVPVVDMRPENGSTELWPGTHRDTTVCVQQGDLKVPEAALAKWRETSPPIQPSVRCGGVLIRDIRLWHRGMPNHTDQPRPMIAMIHYISWWNSGESIRFPVGTEPFFQHPDLKTSARFVEGEIDYIHHNQAYDFQK
jgi:hypothetical protein